MKSLTVKCNERNQRGFTLIEAMVTMLIVSIGLLAMANLLITAIRVNKTNEVRLEASALAQTTMAYYITQVRSQSGITVNATPPTLANTATSFTKTLTFTPATTVECGYTNVKVKLAWTMYGQTKSVEIISGAMTEKTGGC